MSDRIGYRVAHWRTLAGMTQQQLADRLGVTRPYIGMIENGQRAVTKRTLLIGLAQALGVSTNDLTGQPRPPRTRDDLAIWSAVPLLRGALDDDPDDTAPVDVDSLAARVDEAMRARMMCDYPLLARLLPEVVADTRRLAEADDDRAPALFVRAAVTAALTIKPFGHVDLAARLAERAELAATLADDPACTSAAAFTAAQVALASGTVGGQQRSLTTAAQAAARAVTLDWQVMLHLHAALSAASLHRPALVADHYKAAEDAAAHTPADPWRMEATPANVGVWRVSIAVENGEPERAPEYAGRVNPHDLRTPQRQARLHLDTARGHFAAADHDNTVRSLLVADGIAPSEVRTRSTVREIVGQMVRDTRGGGSTALLELARRVGVDPADPDGDPGV